MEQTTLSIVIPVFNRSKIVGATLESVARQTYRPFNLILIDNASTDNTREVLTHWKDSIEKSPQGTGIHITVTDCKKPGAAAARNVGLELVKTPWVMYFDSDDIMSPDHVELAVKDIENNPDADIIGWDTEIVNTDMTRLRISPFSTSHAGWKNLFNGLLSTQHYCTRTHLMRKAGGWNEKVYYWIDIELGARLLSLSPVLYKSEHNDKRVIIVSSDNSITATPDTDPARIEPALQSISQTLGPHKRNHILLKRIIEAAKCSRAGSQKGKSLYSATLKECNNLSFKLLLKTAYHYTKAGGRGIALIYRHLPFYF